MSLTEGIEGPYALGEALFLPKGALVQPMVTETVHEDISCSSMIWRHKESIGMGAQPNQWRRVSRLMMTAIPQATFRGATQPYTGESRSAAHSPSVCLRKYPYWMADTAVTFYERVDV